MDCDDTLAIHNLKRNVWGEAEPDDLLVGCSRLSRNRALIDLHSLARQPRNRTREREELPNFDPMSIMLHMIMLYNPLRGNRFMDFLAMMNESGENMTDVPTPLNSEHIKQLERKKFADLTTALIGHEIADQCAVCQEQYKPDDTVIILPCAGKHYYHEACIEEWLSKLSKKCPICRQDLSEQ